MISNNFHRHPLKKQQLGLCGIKLLKRDEGSERAF